MNLPEYHPSYVIVFCPSLLSVVPHQVSSLGVLFEYCQSASIYPSVPDHWDSLKAIQLFLPFYYNSILDHGFSSHIHRDDRSIVLLPMHHDNYQHIVTCLPNRVNNSNRLLLRYFFKLINLSITRYSDFIIFKI